MESFDVVIIGAGPAGLKCAETLGNSKFSVLLLEKNPEIGPKVCAGGLTGKDIEYLSLPEELIDFQYKDIRFHINETNSVIKYDKNFVYTIDRKNLGQWQLKKLDNFKNIEVRVNSKVTKIEKEYVQVDAQKIGYKFLVGADGSASITKKYLRINPKNVGIAIQYIIPTQKYKEFEIFFEPKLFSAWYAWIFPHKDYVSIGCGCDPNIVSSDKLMKHFHSWLKKKKIDVSEGKYESFVLDSVYHGILFDNVFLVGDAAGFVSGLTGEGIYEALISGEEIGKMIINSGYKSDKIDDLLQMKKRHTMLMNMLIKSGRYRTVILYLLVYLVKVPFLEKKAIDWFV